MGNYTFKTQHTERDPVPAPPLGERSFIGRFTGDTWEWFYTLNLYVFELECLTYVIKEDDRHALAWSYDIKRRLNPTLQRRYPEGVAYEYKR